MNKFRTITQVENCRSIHTRVVLQLLNKTLGMLSVATSSLQKHAPPKVMNFFTNNKTIHNIKLIIVIIKI